MIIYKITVHGNWQFSPWTGDLFPYMVIEMSILEDDFANFGRRICEMTRDLFFRLRENDMKDGSITP